MLQSYTYYYHKIEFKKSRCNEYLLCMLACCDLTFTGLNLDMYFLREFVAILNVTRSVIFLLANVLIYTYYSP